MVVGLMYTYKEEIKKTIEKGKSILVIGGELSEFENTISGGLSGLVKNQPMTVVTEKHKGWNRLSELTEDIHDWVVCEGLQNQFEFESLVELWSEGKSVILLVETATKDTIGTLFGVFGRDIAMEDVMDMFGLVIHLEVNWIKDVEVGYVGKR